MTAAALRLDLEQCRVRTRWTMTVSLIAHALLFLWIMTMKSTVSELPIVTEITFLEPGDLAPAAPAEAAPAPAAPQSRTVQGATVKNNEDVHFVRLNREADVALDPSSDRASRDEIDTRLAALQRDATPTPIGSATSNPPTSLFGTSPATVAGSGGSGTSPVSLTRGQGLGGSSALTLSRGTTPGAPAALSAATVGGGQSAASAPAKAGNDTAHRTIAGASLMGPVADRPVLFYKLPDYPDWAKQEAVEGTVTLYFVVRADGGVKENIVVQKTAGFGDFDENARNALRSWRFQALKDGRTGEQWGTITFHFRLQNAG
jgi:TonB family protein